MDFFTDHWCVASNTSRPHILAIFLPCVDAIWIACYWLFLIRETSFSLRPLELLLAALHAWCLVLGRHFLVRWADLIRFINLPFPLATSLHRIYNILFVCLFVFSVRKQLVNIPSFVVRLDSQKHIDFALRSPFGGGRAGRVKRKNLKKGADGGEAEEDDE